MLSRVAENLFWMGRYIERACNIARFSEVNYYLSLDLDPEYVQWEPLVHITGDYDEFQGKCGKFDAESVMRFLVLNTEYVNSVYSAIHLSRENARSAREYLPVEFWEELNALRQRLCDDVGKDAVDAAELQHLCHRITSGGANLQGISDNSMWHGEGFHFYKLGTWIERADKTSRFLHAKYFYLLPDPNDVGSALDDLHWMALLHSLDALDIYHRQYGLVTPDKVIQFLVLDNRFPRAIAFCLRHALDCLVSIRSENSVAASLSLEGLRELIDDITVRKAEDIILGGLHEFINDFQNRLNGISDTVQLDFF